MRICRRIKGKLGDAAIHSDIGFPASRHETEKEVGTDRNIKKGHAFNSLENGENRPIFL